MTKYYIYEKSEGTLAVCINHPNANYMFELAYNKKTGILPIKVCDIELMDALDELAMSRGWHRPINPLRKNMLEAVK